MMGETGQTWQQTRSDAERFIKAAPGHDTPPDSHIFDGKHAWRDGKVWQVCDITDPLLKGLFDNAQVRPVCDRIATGWYHQGLWAKCKGIMKTKIMAIAFKRNVADSAFAATVEAPNRTPRLGGTAIRIPLPDLNLTQAELATMASRKYYSSKGEVRDRREKAGYTIYPSKRRHGDKGLGGESPQNEEIDDDNEDADDDSDVDELRLDESGSPSAQLHSERRFTPVDDEGQKPVDGHAEDIDLGNESGSEGDEYGDEGGEAYDEGNGPEGLEDDDEDSDMDRSLSARSSSDVDEGPETVRIRAPTVYEDGDGDDEEAEGFYGEEDEYEQGYDDDGLDAIEGEEFGGGQHEEEGFGDDDAQ